MALDTTKARKHLHRQLGYTELIGWRDVGFLIDDGTIDADEAEVAQPGYLARHRVLLHWQPHRLRQLAGGRRGRDA